MYFPDLAQYQYDLPRPLPEVLTVGWLKAGHVFPVGALNSDIVRTLEALLTSHRAHKMRGFHYCDLCPAREPIHVHLPEGPVFLSSAEIWLPAADGTIIFAAPDLILHYVSAHRYLPPVLFQRAIQTASRWADWNAKLEADCRLEAAFAK